jgi:MFS family permease
MFSVMVGAGETYFPAFALALGVDKVTAGLVATVPMLLGAALQLVSPWAVRRLGSNGRWVAWTAVAQAASFVPLIVAAALGAIPTLLLFAVVSMYWAAGFASGPAWTTWIETLVPARIRERYFARRTVWCYVALLLWRSRERRSLWATSVR